MKSLYFKNENVILSKNNYHNPNNYNALDSGIAFLLFVVTIMLIEPPVQSLLKIVYKSTQDYGLVICLGTIIPQAIILLISFLFSKIRKVGMFSGGGFVCKFDAVNSLFGVMLCFGAYFLLFNTHYAFANDWTNLVYLTDYNTYQFLTGAGASLEDSNPILLLLYSFIIVPLMPAICEEALFRGVIMRGLRQFGNLFSVICSAFIFAIMHGNFEQFVLQFAIGLAICSAVTLTDNIFVGMAMHFIYNLSTVLLTAVPTVINTIVPNFIYLYDVLGIVLGFVFLIIGCIYFAKMFLSNYKRKILNMPKKVKFKNYFVICDQDQTKESTSLFLYGGVLTDYYERSCKYKFFTGKGFVDFNKKSNKILSIIVLSIGILLAIIKIIVSI